MNLVTRWLVPLALLQVLACSSSVEQPSEGGSGGGGGSSNTTSGTTSGTTSTATGTASTGAGGAPVECDLGEGAPPGSPCAQEGEICDFAGSGCWVACTDGVWVEDCTECPAMLPEAGTDCSDYYGVGPCTYDLDCGSATATCDGPTLSWVVDAVDCG